MKSLESFDDLSRVENDMTPVVKINETEVGQLLYHYLQKSR